MGFGTVVTGLGAIAFAGWAAIEWQFRQRAGNALEMTTGKWNLEVYEPHHYQLVGEFEIKNPTPNLEIFVPELTAEATLLSKESLAGIDYQITVTPNHPDAPARADGYWFGYIVKIGKTTRFTLTLDIKGSDLSTLQSAWIRVNYMTYGPEGRVPKTRHVVVPLKFPAVEDSANWRSAETVSVLPIRTHLLTHLDSPLDIVQRYVLPHAQPGDVVAIAESPLALMQDRFHHPSTVKPGWLARRICYFFMPTSSLATACGMQTLVDIVGSWRVLGAFLGGAFAKKFLDKPGLFYELAGEQARLIDDVTGTLPPYDQFIVLGPENVQAVVDDIRRKTGLAAAIVDVNDLRAVKVLAATDDVSQKLLEAALVSNPAGNADEQTPIVLIRPIKPEAKT
ncbi:F420-0:Gamma-glutamyl ligase [Vacuolonema iberomarrocanum]|uniref:F420-0:Gamma-glutamyl ligase n=1 Tax=Vacuolonema iberomarrocanum TaxID=3454632 RepID=UPI0019EBEE9B|nr:F420-0:Gamma-glutamyl ligase [filamentous cyanobacterium LEGE 07170]